jgi:hypothetical protein
MPVSFFVLKEKKMHSNHKLFVLDLAAEATLELEGTVRASLITVAESHGFADWSTDMDYAREIGNPEKRAEVYFMFACFLLLAIGDDNF